MKRVKFLVFTIISLMPLTAYSQKGITSNYYEQSLSFIRETLHRITYRCDKTCWLVGASTLYNGLRSYR